MNSIVVILFFISIPLLGAYMVIYARKLASIAEYAHENQIEIFGAKYKNVYHLYGDISFLNNLWAQGCYEEIEDEVLTELVASAHKMLRIGVVTMTLIVFGFISSLFLTVGI